ncbi:AAA family ATPase [Hyphomicrobium sp.]|uniref:AAA family ATPase n=1 Tax=Hyphomicrobium sp. TaxID=82 RepID=UPI002BD25C32|nr:AAA family ATPase [Hyphomicrobium sp.]HRQ28414.1 AAA family ATPase [Hyphomicrobium sp.]
MAHEDSRIPEGWSAHIVDGQVILLPPSVRQIPLSNEQTLPLVRAQLAQKVAEAQRVIRQIDKLQAAADVARIPDEDGDETTGAVANDELREAASIHVQPEPAPLDFSAFDASLGLEALWDAEMTDTERMALREVIAEPDAWRDCVQVLAPDARRALQSDHQALLPDGNRSDKQRIERIVERLGARELFPGFAGWRRIARVTDELDRAIAALHDEFPNFGDVIEFIRDHGALAACRRGRLTLGAVLLNGPPGVGKTEFVGRLASLLHVPSIFIDMASAQTSAALAGSDEFWDNAKPGRIFETVIEGECASPLVTLDELDKATGDQRFDPLAPLYRLLEPASACRFSDASVPRLLFDASHVLWFATTNDIAGLPKALLSRFTVFQITVPDVAQAQDIARRLYARMTAGVEAPPTVDPDVFEALAKHSTREFKRILESALARAVREGSSRVALPHVRLGTPATRRTGFV